MKERRPTPSSTCGHPQSRSQLLSLVGTPAGWTFATVYYRCLSPTPIGTTANADAKLSYNTSRDRYRDVVAKSSSWKGTCWILRLDFADTLSHEVRVRFK